jgi:hypothetical protein
MSLSSAGSQTGCDCKAADTLGQWPLLARLSRPPIRSTPLSGVMRISVSGRPRTDSDPKQPSESSQPNGKRFLFGRGDI